MAENYTKQLRLQLINAVILFLLNWPYFIDAFNRFSVDKLLHMLSVVFLANLFIAIVINFNKYFSILANVFLIGIGSTLAYYRYYYSLLLDEQLVHSVFNTDSNEIFERLNLSIILWSVIFGVLPACFVSFIRLKIHINIITWVKQAAKHLLLVLVGFVFLAVVHMHHYTLKSMLHITQSFLPFNYIIATKNYADLQIRNSLEEKNDISKGLEFALPEHSNNLKVVLIIGESARYDRFSIHGYERETNPNLAKISDLISFSDAYALATSTVFSIKYITKLNPNKHETSILEVFNKLGFKTYWLSNQGIKYKDTNSIALEADRLIFSDTIRQLKLGYNYDEDMIPMLDEAMNDGRNSFIVMHTIGSHSLYDLRYPQEFRKFQPVCLTNKFFLDSHECTDLTKLRNSYDNTIYYTDHFLSKVFNYFKDHKALVIYVGDHGESLGENGKFYHSFPMEVAPKEQLHIPLFIWASDKLKESEVIKDKLRNAYNNKDSAVDHSFVFHSLLDCSGIETSLNEEGRSICSAPKELAQSKRR